LRSCGSDGTRKSVVEVGLGKGTLVLFVRGGEGLELSRIRALAASHGPDVGVLQASPRQHHGFNLPPRDHRLRLAEGEEKGALLVGVAVPAVHEPAKLATPAEGYFFSSRGLRQKFAKCYFNNPTNVTLPQSPRASCLGVVSLWAHSQVAAAARVCVLRLVTMVRILRTRSLGRLNLLDILLRHNALVGGHPGPRKKGT
jgi:hypothetical protein